MTPVLSKFHVWLHKENGSEADSTDRTAIVSGLVMCCQQKSPEPPTMTTLAKIRIDVVNSISDTHHAPL